MGFGLLQKLPVLWPSALAARLENWLEAERDQLALWVPVALGFGIAMWFALPYRAGWITFLLLAGALCLAGVAVGLWRRTGKALFWLGLFAALGCALVWWRAERVSAPVLEHPVITAFTADVVAVEKLPARGIVRLMLAPLDTPSLPPRIRINVAEKDAPTGLGAGARIGLRARIMPPPPAAVPGAYDFERLAWFRGIGGTGRALGSVSLIAPAGRDAGAGLRERLSDHIHAQISGAGEGGVAAALAIGDQGAIPEEDAEAMRQSGLAHLLSVSGLHVTAVVGGTMFLVLKLLALSPWLALRWPLRLIAAGAGAGAAVGYTLLTGAEVPTIRACIAALLILIGLALGREALTLRLVAAGALVVLLIWPEVLVGPSFQLSFAAVTAIVALHENRRINALLARREEGWARRFGRILLSLLLTGLVVELALSPIALFHFHKAGLYGALANIIAIPLTTFVIMPLEALALLSDLLGLGAPIWWLTTQALGLLLALAHTVAAAPGAVTALPVMPAGAFALMLGGGLWLCLWRTKARVLGLTAALMGAIWALSISPPDILVTGDGRHLAVRTSHGSYALLRPRAGEYVRDMLAESAGFEGDLADLDNVRGARCGPDICTVELIRGTRRWRLLATRSAYLVPPAALREACANSDIAVSDRRLPDWCVPRWLKADRVLLAKTGGISIDLARQRADTVRAGGGDHPWINPPRPAPTISAVKSKPSDPPPSSLPVPQRATHLR